ncbi:MAG: hypothetical protein CMK56_04780 [Proteobacteria bacterium]|nr:hypothetical protein [Pseudomonadota bacterium]
MMKIDIFSDVVCPWCFIGKKNLENAISLSKNNLGSIDIKINWKMFQLNPLLPETGISRKEYLASKFGNETNSSNIYKRIENAGRLAGIKFNFNKIQVQPNSLQAHRLIAFIQTKKPNADIVEAIFRNFFIDGQDIGEPLVLEKIGLNYNISKTEIIRYMSSNENRRKLFEENKTAQKMGIQGVPFFIFNDKIAVSGAQPVGILQQALSKTFKLIDGIIPEK